MEKIYNKLFISLIFTITVFGFSLVNTNVVLAQEPEKLNIIEKYFQGLKPAINEGYGGGEEVQLSGDPLALLIMSVINSLLTFLSVIFFLLLLYAGWLWMTARGNEDQTKKAKKMIQNIIIGLVIIILSRLIVEFILTQIGNSAQG